MRSDDSHWDHLLLLGMVQLKLLAGREKVIGACGSWNRTLLRLDKVCSHFLHFWFMSILSIWVRYPSRSTMSFCWSVCVWKLICHSTCHSSFQIWPAVICYQFLCQVWVSSIPVFSDSTWALRFPRMINISCLRTLSLIFCRSMTSSSPFFPWAWFVCA